MDPAAGQAGCHTAESCGVQVFDLDAPVTGLRHFRVDHLGVSGSSCCQDAARLDVSKRLAAVLGEVFNDVDAERCKLGFYEGRLDQLVQSSRTWRCL